jgi:hypothetical protein
MIFNPKYKGIGFISMPYFVFVELLGPIIEFIGYVIMIIGLASGTIYLQGTIPLVVLMVIYGSFLSMGAVLLEEWRLGKHQKISELNKLFLYSLSEVFWFRPILTVWRLYAVITVITGRKHGWGAMKRRGVST